MLLVLMSPSCSSLVCQGSGGTARETLLCKSEAFLWSCRPRLLADKLTDLVVANEPQLQLLVCVGAQGAHWEKLLLPFLFGLGSR